MQELLSIRRRMNDELRTTRIVRELLADRFELEPYLRYLVNARYYAQFSPVIMALGASRSTATHPELARYLLHHAGEEQGHDAWALQDLDDLGVGEMEALTARPVPACAGLVGYTHFLAGHANPVALFGWMYVLEAVGSDLGTIAGRQLVAALGDKASAVRFVAGHGVADADHATELADQIERYVTAAADRADVVYAAEVVADLFLRMYREIGGETARWA
jgi:heme oxygenase